MTNVLPSLRYIMLIFCYVIFRVGGKDKGTRFLTFVEAINSYKGILLQEDLDKAASMCTGLKGHLKARFIVLSDDRVLPPPPAKAGKRQREGEDLDEGNSENLSQKRNRGISGVNLIPVGRGGRVRGVGTRQTPPRAAKGHVQTSGESIGSSASVRGHGTAGRGRGSSRQASGALSRQESGAAGGSAEGGLWTSLDLADGEELPSDLDESQG